MASLDLQPGFETGSSRAGQLNSPHVERYISFEVGGKPFCVAASAVAEIVHPMPLAAVPNSPAWLLGVGSYRGEPIAVIDPQHVLSQPAAGAAKAKVIIFRSRRDETCFGLPIDSLREVIPINPLEFNEDQPGSDSSSYRHNGELFRRIDCGEIFDRLVPFCS